MRPSPRALSGQASVPRSLAVIRSHPSPGGCASRSLPVTSRSAFQKFIWRVRDKPGPRGLYLCVFVLGTLRKEKGRRRRRGGRRARPGCGEQFPSMGSCFLCVLGFAAQPPHCPGLRWGRAAGQAGITLGRGLRERGELRKAAPCQAATLRAEPMSHFVLAFPGCLSWGPPLPMTEPELRTRVQVVELGSTGEGGEEREAEREDKPR